MNLAFQVQLTNQSSMSSPCAYFPTREAADSYLPGAGAAASQTIGD
jgi:hypothetical protein